MWIIICFNCPLNKYSFPPGLIGTLSNIDIYYLCGSSDEQYQKLKLQLSLKNEGYVIMQIHKSYEK